MNEQSMDAMSTDATNRVACNEEASTEVVEEWRPVVGYEGLYEVSNKGRVKSLHSRCGITEYIMKLKLTRYGYYEVKLTKNGNGTSWLVHILVAKAFLHKPDEKDQIDHINAIRTDNRVENLRWATSHENHINPITIENYKKKFSSEEYRQHKREDYYRSGAKEALEAANNTRKRPVYCIELERPFESAREAARQTGLQDSNIAVSCRRFENNIQGISARNGKPVLHWRWSTKEELLAYQQTHKNDTESPS